MAKTSQTKAQSGKNGRTKPVGKHARAKSRGSETAVSLAAHPRARSQIRRAKGWGGLVGFVLTAYLSLSASVPVVQAGERALAAGLVGYLVGWAASVTVWRQLVVAELRLAAEQIAERRAQAAAAAEAAAVKAKPKE